MRSEAKVAFVAVAIFAFSSLVMAVGSPMASTAPCKSTVDSLCASERKQTAPLIRAKDVTKCLKANKGALPQDCVSQLSFYRLSAEAPPAEDCDPNLPPHDGGIVPPPGPGPHHPPHPLPESCKADADALCPPLANRTATGTSVPQPPQPQAMFERVQCMNDNFAKLSAQCQADFGKTVAHACEADAKTLCATAVSAKDGRAVHECLDQNKDKLSSGCAAAIAAAVPSNPPAGGNGTHPHPPPPPPSPSHNNGTRPAPGPVPESCKADAEKLCPRPANGTAPVPPNSATGPARIPGAAGGDADRDVHHPRPPPPSHEFALLACLNTHFSELGAQCQADFGKTVAHACEADAKTLCAEAVAAQDPRAVDKCLRENKAKLSAACAAAVAAAPKPPCRRPPPPQPQPQPPRAGPGAGDDRRPPSGNRPGPVRPAGTTTLPLSLLSIASAGEEAEPLADADANADAKGRPGPGAGGPGAGGDRRPPGAPGAPGGPGAGSGSGRPLPPPPGSGSGSGRPLPPPPGSGSGSGSGPSMPPMPPGSGSGSAPAAGPSAPTGAGLTFPDGMVVNPALYGDAEAQQAVVAEAAALGLDTNPIPVADLPSTDAGGSGTTDGGIRPPHGGGMGRWFRSPLHLGLTIGLGVAGLVLIIITIVCCCKRAKARRQLQLQLQQQQQTFGTAAVLPVSGVAVNYHPAAGGSYTGETSTSATGSSSSAAAASTTVFVAPKGTDSPSNSVADYEAIDVRTSSGGYVAAQTWTRVN